MTGRILGRLMFALLASCAVMSAGPRSDDPAGRIRDLLGIPYVDDAGLDERGRWTLFAHPDQMLDQPGLNCSGFLVAASRRLLGFSGTLAQASQDRLGDSGPTAEDGLDWDFGWDLVLNLSEGHPRCWILPTGDHPAPSPSARSLRGFSIHDRDAWSQLSARWRSDRVYLVAFQRGSGRRLRYHHVGLLLKTSPDTLAFYQTLPRGRVHRLNLNLSKDLDRLCTMFGPGERVLFLEVQP